VHRGWYYCWISLPHELRRDKGCAASRRIGRLPPP
jgi:hypothetical protein